eukprot:evm.model.scf_814.2 EVM.evm.TU.scf_814.2   scf_814:3015-7547(-)
MGREEQLQAFRAFDFDADDGWKEYFRKFEISGADYQAAVTKLKAKWYKRSEDPEFDVSWVAPSPYQRSTASGGPSEGGTTEAGGHKSAKNASSSGNAGGPQPSKPTVRGPPFTLTFLHLGMVCTGVIALVPLTPILFTRIFMQLAILAHGYKVITTYGVPKLWPLAQLKAWAARALQSTDFQYFCIALVFLPASPTKLVMVPMGILAVYHMMADFNQRLKGNALWERHGAKATAWLSSHQRAALMVNAHCEILVGAILILRLFTPSRSILNVIMYVQWLRIRYQSVDAAMYHQEVWSSIGQKVEPYTSRVPFLRMPIEAMKRWFRGP